MDVTLAALLLDESGASMVEYGVIIACIAMVAIVALRSFGPSVNSLYADAGGAVSRTSTNLHY